MADKFIMEAKEAGWLVSPFRAAYFVPTAQDLMVIGWLAEPSRSELLISRYLSARGVRFWCVSSWARERGLEMGGPLFATDVSRTGEGMEKGADRKQLQASLQERASRVASLPFLESLVIVPKLPAFSDRPQTRVSLTPEGSGASTRRNKEEIMVGILSLVEWAIKRQAPTSDLFAGLKEDEKRARAIPYTLGPDTDDTAWIVALLASFGIPRVEEFLSQYTQRKDTAVDKAAVQRWASLIGPPQPNENWNEVIRGRPFPYLLVPKLLWSAMGADQASRRHRVLTRLGAA